MKIQVALNGRKREFDVHPMKRMLDVLREDAGLTGAKEGCGEGECGACSVIMDGRLVDTCLVPAIQMAGSRILTVEGLSEHAELAEKLDPLQRIFLEEGAVHCGFCTPGMIMAAVALLMKNPSPSDEEIRVGLSGNICRCTGYEKICRAVSRAASEGYGERARGILHACGTEISAEPIFGKGETGKYFAPGALSEALDIKASNGDILVLSGGTDIGPDVKNGKLAPSGAMDIFSLPEMNGIELIGGLDDEGSGHIEYIRIGACSTNTDIIESPIIREMLPALVAASLRSGAVAIQNRATIGGNICTASGAGDLPVVLLALGASVTAVSSAAPREAEQRGQRGRERQIRLDDFITGYRRNALEPGELLKDIIIPVPRKGSKQVFYKRGSRKALTLSRASLAFYIYVESGRIVEFRAAAGSMSPVPVRLANLDKAMRGKEITESLPAEAARIAYSDVNPRKTPLYRKTMIANLTHRFFSEVVTG